jgi:RNA polymerase sigma-70 factor (ECF subfamily)
MSLRRATTSPALGEPSASLLAGLRAGERGAQAAFFDRHVAGVEHILFRLLGPDSELEDFVQETFILALTCIDSFRGDEAALPGWLRAVAVRTAHKRIRARMTRRRWGLRMRDVGLDLPESLAPQVHAALTRAHAALDTLDAGDRTAFVLRFVEGLELTECAQACGVSLATVKRRIARARAQVHRIAERDALLQSWLGEGDA